MEPLNSRDIGQTLIGGGGGGLSSFEGIVGALESVLYREVPFIQSAVLFSTGWMVCYGTLHKQSFLTTVCM